MTDPVLSTDPSGDQDRRDAEVLTLVLQAAMAPPGSDAAAGLGGLLLELRADEDAALERVAAMLQLRRVGARISTSH
jgi:hypothetical protein